MRTYNFAYHNFYDEESYDPNFVLFVPELRIITDVTQMTDSQRLIAKFFTKNHYSIRPREKPFTLGQFKSKESLYDITKYLAEEAGSYYPGRSAMSRRSRAEVYVSQDPNFSSIRFLRGMSERAAGILTEKPCFSIPTGEWKDYDGNRVSNRKSILLIRI